VINTLFW